MEEINLKNERALIDQSELYKSKLVVEYDRYEKLETEYEKIKAASVKKVEELENSIEERIENIKKVFDEKLAKYEVENPKRGKLLMGTLLLCKGIAFASLEINFLVSFLHQP